MVVTAALDTIGVHFVGGCLPVRSQPLRDYRRRAAGAPRPPQDAGGAWRSVRRGARSPGFRIHRRALHFRTEPDPPAGIFLIETHSEHLILRLLRRIEETHGKELPEGKPALRPDQVSVVFLDQSNGEVRATPLRIDETGEFVDRWPQGFFEERSKELFY